MNPVERNGSPHPLYKSIRFDDFDVTWAGPNPFRPGFCFGSDDGRLRFTDEEGKIVGEQFPQVASREAINGVAFHGACLAVSTRAEVTLFSLLDGHAKSVTTTEIPIGAHGVIATASGYFVATCGRRGFLFVKANAEHEPNVVMSSGSENAPNLYKVIVTQDAHGNEALAFAARQNGFVVMPFSRQPGDNFAVTKFGNLDLVDVCVLDPDSNSTAVAAAGRDGTLILFRDALNDKNAFSMKLEPARGTVYRALSCRGHIFVMTSEAIHMLTNLGRQWVKGEPIHAGSTRILTIPLEGVDANPGGEKHLLVVTADEVLRFDIDLMEQIKPENANGEFRDSVPTVIKIDQQWRGVPQETRPLAGVA